MFYHLGSVSTLASSSNMGGYSTNKIVAVMVSPASIPGSTWSIPKLLTTWVKEGKIICVNQIDPYLSESDGEGILENAMKM